MRKIKEKWCYVAPMGTVGPDELYNLPSKAKEAGGSSDHQTLYYLPDGTQVMLNKEKILAPEILFQPDRVGLEYQGIHEMVISSIKRCDIEMRKALY